MEALEVMEGGRTAAEEGSVVIETRVEAMAFRSRI
jgi:hypothetical protein